MLIDLSHPIFAGMPVFPGDCAVEIAQRRFLEKDHYNAFEVRTGMHAGTHADAPTHLVEDTRLISQWPLERFCGEGFLLCGMADSRDIPPDRCILICTGHDRTFGQASYFTEFPQMDEALCERILAARPRCIGLDTPSPDRAPYRVHRRILSAGVPIIENLTGLSALQGRAFMFMALPLRIDAEASLVRAAACIHAP